MAHSVLLALVYWWPSRWTFTFTFMHLADAFIQSDWHFIQVSTFDQLLLSLGIEPMILALLVPCSTSWAKGKPCALNIMIMWVFNIAVFEKSPVDTANYIVPLSKCAPHSAENRTHLLIDGRDCIINPPPPPRRLPHRQSNTKDIKTCVHIWLWHTHAQHGTPLNQSFAVIKPPFIVLWWSPCGKSIP